MRYRIMSNNDEEIGEVVKELKEKLDKKGNYESVESIEVKIFIEVDDVKELIEILEEIENKIGDGSIELSYGEE
jgi:hypothetical protein